MRIRKRLRAANLAIVSRIKIERGCVDCGYNQDPAALHFDHRDPNDKCFCIGSGLERAITNILAEIAKCDVRCANCHATRTNRERHFNHRKPHTK